MGRTKDDMIDRQIEARVAEALGITPELLAEYPYELQYDTARDGPIVRTFVVWEDEAPTGVDYDGDDILETTIILQDEPDGPDA